MQLQSLDPALLANVLRAVNRVIIPREHYCHERPEGEGRERERREKMVFSIFCDFSTKGFANQRKYLEWDSAVMRN